MQIMTPPHRHSVLGNAFQTHLQRESVASLQIRTGSQVCPPPLCRNVRLRAAPATALGKASAQPELRERAVVAPPAKPERTHLRSSGSPPPPLPRLVRTVFAAPMNEEHLCPSSSPYDTATRARCHLNLAVTPCDRASGRLRSQDPRRNRGHPKASGVP